MDVGGPEAVCRLLHTKRGPHISVQYFTAGKNNDITTHSVGISYTLKMVVDRSGPEDNAEVTYIHTYNVIVCTKHTSTYNPTEIRWGLALKNPSSNPLLFIFKPEIFF